MAGAGAMAEAGGSHVHVRFGQAPAACSGNTLLRLPCRSPASGSLAPARAVQLVVLASIFIGQMIPSDPDPL